MRNCNINQKSLQGNMFTSGQLKQNQRSELYPPKRLSNFAQEGADASFSQRSIDFDLHRANSPKFDARHSGKGSPKYNPRQPSNSKAYQKLNQTQPNDGELSQSFQSRFANQKLSSRVSDRSGNLGMSIGSV